MSTVKKLTISLGLLTVPVKASVAARAEKAASFNMLCGVCHGRVTMPTHCDTCGKGYQTWRYGQRVRSREGALRDHH
jgi:non-homologous end joining protein Ku